MQPIFHMPPQLASLDVKGKRVLVRVDFNVPMEQGAISDDTRIRMAIPTIQALLDRGASKVILMSHLGRPEGKDLSLSMKPIAERLSQLLKLPVLFVPDCIGPHVAAAIDSAKTGSVLLLENLRFYPAEEKPKKDPSFVEQLAKLGDAYVNDAFGTAHRAHSSTAEIARFFPEKRAMGLLMEREVMALGPHLLNPQRPFSAVVGGAKISTKIGVLKSLLDKVNQLFIGGAMSYTFFKAKGIPIGNSLVEDNMMELAHEVMAKAEQKQVALYLPIDVVETEKIAPHTPSKTVSMDQQHGIDPGWEGVDVGIQTITTWKTLLQGSKTIFWNGPLGVFEVPPFEKGTHELAKMLGSLKGKAFTVVGGGDSLSALEKLGLTETISHVSTGGGASLEFLEQGDLPGLAALRPE